MKSLILTVALLTSVSLFADSTVVNNDMGPVSLVRKVVSFPIEDCINHLTSHPGSSFYNWRCVVRLTDTVSAKRLINYDIKWGANMFDGKCLGRVYSSSSFAAIEVNRVPGHPVLPKNDALVCIQQAYNMARIGTGLSVYVLSTHTNINPDPVVTPIAQPTPAPTPAPTPFPVPSPYPIPPRPPVRRR
jgi:hypothetical protein